jgi:hypothetical protein
MNNNTIHHRHLLERLFKATCFATLLIYHQCWMSSVFVSFPSVTFSESLGNSSHPQAHYLCVGLGLAIDGLFCRSPLLDPRLVSLRQQVLFSWAQFCPKCSSDTFHTSYRDMWDCLGCFSKPLMLTLRIELLGGMHRALTVAC